MTYQCDACGVQWAAVGKEACWMCGRQEDVVDTLTLVERSLRPHDWADLVRELRAGGVPV